MTIRNRLPQTAISLLSGAAIIAAIVFGAMYYNTMQPVAAQDTAEACTPQPTTLRYDRDRGENFLAYRLTWVRDQDCPADSYKIFRYTSRKAPFNRELIGTTTKNTFTDRDVPGEGHLTYLVRSVKNGEDGNGVSITARRAPPPPTKDPAPVKPDPVPADIMPERSLVCFYEQGGNIHSISGVRECTMQEINHALSEPAQ